MSEKRIKVHLLDYGAGNVRSVKNAIEHAGYEVEEIKSSKDLTTPGLVTALVFPGVGAFSAAVEFLDDGRGYREALLEYINSGRPFMGVCLGLQLLFEGSEEAPGLKGLGLISGMVQRFPPSDTYSVPHMGWNGVTVHGKDVGLTPDLRQLVEQGRSKLYFVHSYRAMPSKENASWVLATSDFGQQRFVAAIQRSNVFATQFHPEKSGQLGLNIFNAFLKRAVALTEIDILPPVPSLGVSDDTNEKVFDLINQAPSTSICRRIIACLDVRSNDSGDLVVTKGDQYDVRERATEDGSRNVRNLGKPVSLCERYYTEGADEVCFLNITAFREGPLEDAPMLAVLEAASERVFVPLTVGGGIRHYTDPISGKSYTALEVASRYFRAGADKVSIGSEAVTAAEDYFSRGCVTDGSTAIEQIAQVYGRQAVVVSIDPKRVYVDSSEGNEECKKIGHVIVEARKPGPNGERFCWYQCTIKGGREGRPICAVRLALAVEALGAGELLVNCVDNDGQKDGFDEPLLAAVCAKVKIPVVASSGAGSPIHFESIFKNTRVEAALAAGIFHRNEVSISEVKSHVQLSGIETRIV
jgi:imidazole glycerol-phosphate synthase